MIRERRTFCTFGSMAYRQPTALVVTVYSSTIEKHQESISARLLNINVTYKCRKLEMEN